MAPIKKIYAVFMLIVLFFPLFLCGRSYAWTISKSQWLVWANNHDYPNSYFTETIDIAPYGTDSSEILSMLKSMYTTTNDSTYNLPIIADPPASAYSDGIQRHFSSIVGRSDKSNDSPYPLHYMLIAPDSGYEGFTEDIPVDVDSDGDGILDKCDYDFSDYNTNDYDCDGDGIGNLDDLDDDGNGISDFTQLDHPSYDPTHPGSDFDSDGVINSLDDDIDGDGIKNDYDDDDYSYDNLTGDPIDPSDDYDESDSLPDPNTLPDDYTATPDDMGDFADNTNIDPDPLVNSGDYATTKDVHDLSSDQQDRTDFLNSQQHSRNESLKEKIQDSAEFLNSEQHARDQTSETNADKRHNDLKDQLDDKFSALDKNQQSSLSKIKSNIDATNSNLNLIAQTLGVIKNNTSSSPSISVTTPTASEIGEAVGQSVHDKLIDTNQIIDTTVTDNLLSLDKTDSLTTIQTKYSDRYDLFITTLQGSDLFSLPFGIFSGPSGSGASIQTVNIGKWGSSTDQTATIDYSDYDNIWDILRAVLLLLTSFSCFKILVLKKA